MTPCLEVSSIGSVGGSVDGRRDARSQCGTICIDFGPRSYILQLGAGANLSFGCSRGGGCSPT